MEGGRRPQFLRRHGIGGVVAITLALMRWPVAIVLGVVVTIGPATGGPGSAASATATAIATATGNRRESSPAYARPVPGAVLRPFQPPPTPYAAGHRGVDLAAAQGTPVGAAGAGEVTFAGTVGGRGVVVIAHADGISTEYEPVTSLVRTGSVVTRGSPVARVLGDHAGCSVSCLHWGASRDGAYFDPLSLLAPLGPVRLVPIT